MDTELMTAWVSSVWGTRQGCRMRSLLLLDSFKAHLGDEVRKSIKKTSTDIAMIAGELTCSH